MLKNLVQSSKISYKTDTDQSLFTNINFSINQHDKIALIGINGAGKSSLMKIVSGATSYFEGDVKKDGKVFYLPQTSNTLNIPIYDYISQLNESWWEVIETASSIFKIGFNPEQNLQTLSGGELKVLNLSIGISLKPELFLLDEPTNHLDLPKLRQLAEFVKVSNSAFLIVSHNAHFIDQWAKQIWELRDKSLTKFTGNYSAYRKHKKVLQEAQLADFNAAQKEAKKAMKAQLKETIRAARTVRLGKLMSKTNDRSIPKIVRNNMRNSAQKAHGKNKDQLKRNHERAHEKLCESKAVIRKLPHLSQSLFPEHKGTLINLVDCKLILPNKQCLLQKINLKIEHNQRISIIAPNGSGKSTLAKALDSQGGYELIGKSYFVNGLKVEYISQKYDLIDLDLSLIENLRNHSPSLEDELLMKNLGNMLFDDEDIHEKSKVLSGSELVRLAFAMVLTKQPDLLILDEPTNNLDLETIEVISNGLKQYKGAMMIISHDIDFLKQVEISDVFTIENSNLIEIKLDELLL